MFLSPRREAPPEGGARAFLLHHPFRFPKREKRTRKKPIVTHYLSSALIEHIRGRPPQIQNLEVEGILPHLREAKKRIHAEGSQPKIRTALNHWARYTATSAGNGFAVRAAVARARHAHAASHVPSDTTGAGEDDTPTPVLVRPRGRAPTSESGVRKHTPHSRCSSRTTRTRT